MTLLATETLSITEVFYSLQGETSFSGLPTSFIRLAQCNLRCSWCDTTYSFKRGTPHTLPSLIDFVKNNQSPYVCISGGEPLLQPAVHSLMSQLCDEGFIVSLETGGSLPIAQVDPRVTVILDIKCPGSGMEKKNLWSNLNAFPEKGEIKFVIQDETDYLYAKDVIKQYSLERYPLLFSPVANVLNPGTLADWIVRDKLPARFNLQLHKVLWPNQSEGV